MGRQYQIYVVVMPVVLMSWVFMVLLSRFGIQPGNPAIRYVTIGLFFGTMFGHTTLAAAWTAFGPGMFLLRLIGSICWIFFVVSPVLVDGITHGLSTNDMGILICGVIGQWLIVQIPLWVPALASGVRLRHKDDQPDAFDRKTRQFGMAQLLIFTTVMCVLFIFARILLLPFLRQFHLRGEAPIFIFLAVAGMTLTPPILIAALLPTWSLPATLATTLLLISATFAEVPVSQTFYKGPGPDLLHFFWINGFSVAWIVLICMLVRFSGYSLRSHQPGKRSAP